MKYGMRLQSEGRKHVVVIASKRNNWRPTRDEPELPLPLTHVAEGLGLSKVGLEGEIDQQHGAYSLILEILRGNHTHKLALDKVVMEIVAKSTPHIHEGCRKLRRQGLRFAPDTIASETFEVWKQMFRSM